MRRVVTDEFSIVSLPRPKGGESLFGISFRGIGKVHPLLASGNAEDIVPIAVERLDPDFLIGRGGALTNLRQQKVLIVGCGSLGGRIAIELSRTGIASLTLIDHEQLVPENTYRHVLGRLHWYKNKASALKYAIETQIPYINVKAIEQTIEQAVLERSAQFERFDLVIFATGNPTVELRMNRLLAGLEQAPSAVFTWLEPLGIGGHALLVQPTSRGCFRCLFEDSYDPDVGLYNKAAFSAPGQSFGRAVSGCGSLFMPFSSLDAASTAVLASRLAIDALTGREKGNPLLSWKGDASEFTAEQFELSDRFRMSDLHRFDHRYSYQSDGCPVCIDRDANGGAADERGI
jgi:molybdopterin/thiamine biosynthesis adenylyltransferase